MKIASDMSLSYYGLPLIITTSGGKDSDVCLKLAELSGIPYEVLHNHTTADAPQTVYHVRNQFRELELSGIKCTLNYPYYKGKRTTLWELIPQKMIPPTFKWRYCCAILKENGGRGRMITTGVRWEESTSRKGRGIYEKNSRKKENQIILMNDNDDARSLFENCRLKAKRVCNPIIDWTEADVWAFHREHRILSNPLYQSGFQRVGCIGCPLCRKGRYKEFEMFPAYERMYRRAFDKLAEARIAAGKTDANSIWRTGDGIWTWWMEEDKNQMSFDEIMQEIDLELDEAISQSFPPQSGKKREGPSR